MTDPRGPLVPHPRMNRTEWILLAALAALWGSSFYFFKILVATLPPFTVVLGRVGLAALVLNLWCAVRPGRAPVPARTWGAFAIMGLLNNVIPYTLIAFGETRIASGVASILNATTPVFTVFVAHLLTTNETLTPAKAAGVALGFLGVTVLIGADAFAGLGRGDVIGELACLIAALSYAFAGLYGRRFRGMSPVTVATGQITASAVMLIPLAAIVDRPWTLSMPGASAWAALAGLALLGTVLAYILYFRILATAGATNLLLVTFLLPVTALLLGWLALGETLGSHAFAGMAMIGLGLACIDGRALTLCRRRDRGHVATGGKSSRTMSPTSSSAAG